MVNEGAATGAPPPERSHLGWILSASVVAMLVVWTYILFGIDGVEWWGKLAATVVVLFSIAFAWRWRRRRLRKQLEVLERWADQQDRRPLPNRR
ncbi:MAG: hypothetical protein ACREJM_09335 [Candidatus Saccharimonadales bacterium]